jgi:hypothetical protein
MLADYRTSQLLLVKQILLATDDATAELLPHRRAIALITLDFAIETLLYAVARELDPQHEPPGTFQALRRGVDKLLRDRGLGPLPLDARIAWVHDLRNDAQHKGKYPTEEELRDSRVHVRDALDELARVAWNLSLDAVHLRDLIVRSECREWLEKAADAFDTGEYLECARASSYALSRAMVMVRQKLVGPSTRDATHHFRGSDFDARRRWEAVSRMQETVLRQALGLRSVDLDRLRELTGHMEYIPGGGPIWYGEPKPVSRELAEWAQSFAGTAIWGIERTLPVVDEA